MSKISRSTWLVLCLIAGPYYLVKSAYWMVAPGDTPPDIADLQSDVAWALALIFWVVGGLVAGWFHEK